MSKVDQFYVNLIGWNASDQDELAQYEGNMNKTFLGRCTDWEMAVARFSVPSARIPLFIWQPGKYFVGLYRPGAPPGDDPTVSRAAGVWGVAEVEILTPDSLYNKGEREHAVYSYEEWIAAVNFAFGRAYRQVTKGVVFIDIPDYPPKMIYDSTTKLFSILAPDPGVYAPQSPADEHGKEYFTPREFAIKPVDDAVIVADTPYVCDHEPFNPMYLNHGETLIFMSSDLYNHHFPSLSAYTYSLSAAPAPSHGVGGLGTWDGGFWPLEYSSFHMTKLIVLGDRINNYRPADALSGNLVYPSIDYPAWEHRAQWNCLAAWNRVRRLVIMSSTLPVVPEHLLMQGQAGDKTEPIISDFEIPLEHEGLHRNVIYYQPQSYRWMSLASDNDLHTVDYRILYQTYDDLALRNLWIPPRHDVNVKLAFRRINKVENLLRLVIKELEFANNREKPELKKTNELTLKAVHKKGHPASKHPMHSW